MALINKFKMASACGIKILMNVHLNNTTSTGLDPTTLIEILHIFRSCPLALKSHRLKVLLNHPFTTLDMTGIVSPWKPRCT